MIQMAVGEDDHGNSEFSLVQKREDLRGIRARIYQESNSLRIHGIGIFADRANAQTFNSCYHRRLPLQASAASGQA